MKQPLKVFGGVNDLTSFEIHHLVILLDNGMYKCSCMSLVDRGITCRHYFGVMLRTPEARFHMELLNQRWFITNHPELKNRLFYPASKFKVD